MPTNKSVRFDIEGRNKTTAAFQQANRGLVGLTKTATKLGSVLAGAFAVRSIVRFHKETLQSVDAIGKFADRAGVTTSELQKMRFAFDFAGVGVEAVDKALLTFGKRLGKAQQGIGALKGGLKGGEEALLAKLQSTNSVSEALNVMFRAMGEAESQTRKLALADAAFGQSGLRMTAAFRDGSKEFFKAKKRMQDLGLVLDDVSIRKVEQLNDSITVLSSVIKINFTKAFLESSDAILGATEALTEFIVSMRGGEGIISHTSDKMSLFERIVRSIAFELDKAGAAMHGFFGDEKGQKEFLERAKENRRIILESQKPLEVTPLPLTKVMPPVGGLTGSNSAIGDSDSSGLAQALFDHQVKLNEEKAKQKVLEDEIRQSSIRELAILEQRANGHEEIAVLYEKQFEAEDKLGRKLTESEGRELEAFLAQKKHLEEIITINEQVGGISERVFDRMGDGLVNALQRGEGAFDSLKNVALAALFDIGQELFRIAAIEPLKKAAGSFLGSIDFGSIFGGSFADGGFVSGAKPILVGERGPEIFSPGASGSIIPNEKIGGGGGATTVNLNISTGVQGTVRAELMGLMPQITDQVKNAVAEARQRGGSFSTAMGV